MTDLTNTEQVVDAINSMVERAENKRTVNLIDLQDRPVQPSVRGIGQSRPSTAGGAINSPLTEPDATTRTFFASTGELVSSDGLIIVRPSR